MRAIFQALAIDAWVKTYIQKLNKVLVFQISILSLKTDVTHL
jgi:hypothetical protein